MKVRTSIVTRTFGIAGREAGPFVRKWLPRRWKPRVLVYGLWDNETSDRTTHGSITRIIRIENFPSELFSWDYNPKDERGNQRINRIYKKCRDDALRWLYHLEDSGFISLCNGGFFGNGVAGVDSRFSFGKSLGSFNAIFIPAGPKTAIMVSCLTESSIGLKRVPPTTRNARWPRRRRRTA